MIKGFRDFIMRGNAAAVLYFLIVMPMNQIIARRRHVEASESTPVSVSEDIALLQEIRDLLKQQV